MKSLNVFKVGGAVLENPQSLDTFIEKFTSIGGNKVLVHGGGRSATALAKRMGVETVMVDGRRITDDAMLEIVVMVYGGLINKTVTAKLQQCGVTALGLTGGDLNLILSHRRPEINGIDFGNVGDIDKVNDDRLAWLINGGIVPVISPLTTDGQGHLLNTNADTMASAIATALAAEFDVTLTFAFEKPGVLENPNDDSSVIKTINHGRYIELKETGIISAGMIPKLDNAFKALEGGVKKVVIIDNAGIGVAECGTILTAG